MIAEARRKAAAQTLELELPDMESVTTIHPLILDLMEMWVEVFGEYKDPHELILYDIDALNAYFAHKKGIRFMVDYPKRPANMQ